MPLMESARSCFASLSVSSSSRLCLTSSVAFFNSAKPFARLLARSGNFLGPKTIRAITMMTISSGIPIPNMRLSPHYFSCPLCLCGEALMGSQVQDHGHFITLREFGTLQAVGPHFVRQLGFLHCLETHFRKKPVHARPHN